MTTYELKKLISECVDEFLNESIEKYNILKQKYSKTVSESIFDLIVLNDPTTIMKDIHNVNKCGIYVDWMCRKYIELLTDQKSRFREDISKIKRNLEIFDKVKSKLPSDGRDINKYNFTTLYAAISPYIEAENKKDQSKANAKEIKTLYNGDDFFIGIPLTMEASIKLGRNTQWCTAVDDPKTNVFDDYSSRGELIVIIIKHPQVEKYQFHIETNQFMDAADNEVDRTEFFKKHPKIQEILIKHGIPKYKYLVDKYGFYKSMGAYGTALSILKQFKKENGSCITINPGNITRYDITEDNKLVIKGDVDIHQTDGDHTRIIPFPIERVEGYVSVSTDIITRPEDIENFPKDIQGTLRVSSIHRYLTSLQGLCDHVDSGVKFSYCKLLSDIRGCPTSKIGWYSFISCPKLESLDGIPKSAVSVECQYTPITTFKGMENLRLKILVLVGENIKSLDHIPQEIETLMIDHDFLKKFPKEELLKHNIKHILMKSGARMPPERTDHTWSAI